MASHGSARGRAHAGRRWQSGHQANPAICCQMIFLTNDVGRRTPAQAVALMDHDGLGGRSEMKVPVPASTGSRPARRARSVLAAQRQARYPPPPPSVTIGAGRAISGRAAAMSGLAWRMVMVPLAEKGSVVLPMLPAWRHGSTWARHGPCADRCGHLMRLSWPRNGQPSVRLSSAGGRQQGNST